MTQAVPYEVVCDSADREAWLRARRASIGASEIAAVFGESRWASAISLYEAKTQGTGDAVDSEAAFWGSRLERIIADVYAERTGRPTRWSGVLLRSREYPWLTATLDALTAEHGDPSDGWPFDSKTANAYKADEWAEGAPREYVLQAQQQMLVTGKPRATVGCLLGGQRLVWCDVERDEVEIRRIVHMSRIFWQQSVVARIPPAPDGSDSATRALQALYPNAANTTVVLDAALEALYDELRELKSAKRGTDARIDELENRFKAALGTAQTGVLPGSRNAVTWNPRKGCVAYKKAAESLGGSVEVFERFRGPATRVFGMRDAKEIG